MIQLAHCAIEWTDFGVRVTFPDGAETSAWPHDEPHYYVISHRCGYEDRITQYCREHELAHALIGEEFYGWASRVQRTAALGNPPLQDAALEEGMAQMLQRWVRANERPIIGGVDWDALKCVFLMYVKNLDDEVSNADGS